MRHYYDTHNIEIEAGMFLRCLINNEVVEVVSKNGDLGINGIAIDGEYGFHSLISFCWAYFLDQKLHLIDFEII
jgi:hypothetical protein